MKLLLILPLVFFFALNGAGQVNTAYKVGDKIEVRDFDGSWLPAEILEKADGKYKIHYTGWDTRWDTWVTEERMRRTGTVKTETNPTQTSTTKPGSPEMNGAIPKLNGTAWWVINVYTKGTTPGSNQYYQPYIFCRTGKFDIQMGGFQMGTYTVQGNKLKQVSDGADHLTAIYTITWNAKEKYMELTSGDTVIRLIYNQKSAC